MKKVKKWILIAILFIATPIMAFADNEPNVVNNDKTNSGNIVVEVNANFKGSPLKDLDEVVFSAITGLKLDIKMTGTSSKDQVIDFKLPDGFKYSKTFVDKTKLLTYENENIGEVSFSSGDSVMKISFLKSLEFEVSDFEPEIAIATNANIYKDIIYNGGTVITNFGVEGFYDSKEIKVTFSKSTDKLFEKTDGSYSPDTKAMFYNIKVSTNLVYENDIETVHYIIDMPQRGLRFVDDSLRVYTRTETGAYGDFLFSSQSKNNDNYQVYRLFYATKGKEGNYKAITEMQKFEIEGYTNPLTNKTLVSSEEATLPLAQDMILIPLDKPIPAEFENEPYGFFLRLVNNSNSKLILAYNNEIYNSEYSIETSGNPRMLNSASYYAQQIPTCDIETQVCTPIYSEVDDVSSFGAITDGSITVKVKYGNLGILKMEEGNDTLLPKATFKILDRHEDVAEGKYEGKTISLDNIVSGDKSSDKNNLYVSFEGEQIPLDKILIPSGNYMISEIQAPEGYEVIEGMIDIKVSADALTEYVITNSKIETEPENPVEPEEPVDPETPIVPEKPVDPETPIDPGKPGEPQKPTVPTEPSVPELPSTGLESSFAGLSVLVAGILVVIIGLQRRKINR